MNTDVPKGKAARSRGADRPPNIQLSSLRKHGRKTRRISRRAKGKTNLSKACTERRRPQGQAVELDEGGTKPRTTENRVRSGSPRKCSKEALAQARKPEIIEIEKRRMIEAGDVLAGTSEDFDKMAEVLTIKTIAEAIAHAYAGSHAISRSGDGAETKSSDASGTQKEPAPYLALEQSVANHIDKLTDNLLTRSTDTGQYALDRVYLIASEMEHFSSFEGITKRAERVEVDIEPGHYVKILLTQPDADDPSAAGYVTPTPEGADKDAREAHQANTPEWVCRIERYYLHPDTITALRATGEIGSDDKSIYLEDFAIPNTIYSNPLLDAKEQQRIPLSPHDWKLWATFYHALERPKGVLRNRGKLTIKAAVESLYKTINYTKIKRWRFGDLRQRAELLVLRLDALGIQIKCDGILNWNSQTPFTFEVKENDVLLWTKLFEGTAKERIDVMEELIRKAELHKQKLRPDSSENIGNIISEIDSTPAAYLLMILTNNEDPVHFDELINRADGNSISGVLLFGHYCLGPLLEYNLIEINQFENTVTLRKGVKSHIKKIIGQYEQRIHSWLTGRHEGAPLQLGCLPHLHLFPTTGASAPMEHGRDQHISTVQVLRARLLNGPPHLTPGTVHVLAAVANYCVDHMTRIITQSEVFENWKLERQHDPLKMASVKGTFQQLLEHSLLRKSKGSITHYEIQWENHDVMSALEPLDPFFSEEPLVAKRSVLHEELMSLYLFQTAPYTKKFIGRWQITDIREARTYHKLRREWEQVHRERLTFRQRFDKFLSDQSTNTRYYAVKLLYFFVEHCKNSASWEELIAAERICRRLHGYFTSINTHYFRLCMARIIYYDPYTRTMHLSNDFETQDIVVGLEHFDALDNVMPPGPGIMGVHTAERRIKSYHAKYGKPPSTSTSGFKTMYRIVSEGKWTPYGIPDWPTLIEQCIGVRPAPSRHGCYKGFEGLKYGQREVLADNEKSGEVSRAHDFPGILTALKRGEWVPHGIATWSEFLASIGLEPRCEIGILDGDSGLDKGLQMAENYHEEFGVPPSTSDSGFGGIRTAIDRGAWVDLPSKRSVSNWSAFLRLAGMEPRTPRFARLGRAWEHLCEMAANTIYGDCLTRQILPNGTYPDFKFTDEVGATIIADAKLGSHQPDIATAIEAYIGYCDRMELWCFAGRPRESEIHEGKRVDFLYASQILNRVIDPGKRKELQKALEDFREECRSLSRTARYEKLKEDGVVSLKHLLDEDGM